MPVSLNDMLNEGALEGLAKVQLKDNNYTGEEIEVEKDEIILHGRNLPEFCNAGDEIYLLTVKQATVFKKSYLKKLKVFRISRIMADEKPADFPSDDLHVFMNPDQTEIYSSVGIEEMVAVKKEDIDRIFKYKPRKSVIF